MVVCKENNPAHKAIEIPIVFTKGSNCGFSSIRIKSQQEKATKIPPKISLGIVGVSLKNLIFDIHPAQKYYL